MERNKPLWVIHGTHFIVDVEKLQLTQQDNPENFISLFDMRDFGNGYVFEYDLETRNMPGSVSRKGETEYVRIPELVQLDPEGMAEKYGFTPETIQGKTDFEVMVDQEALKKRLEGVLPTIDIAGHLFYVDVRMDRLRPHDDFLSRGIRFDEIDHWFDEERDAYVIPYNPSTHEFEELPDPVVKIPEELILVSFPSLWKLDPVGYNRFHGWDIDHSLKEYNVHTHRKAQAVESKEIGIEEAIKENLLKYPELAGDREQAQKPGKKI